MGTRVGVSRIVLAGMSVTAMAAGCGDHVLVDDTVDTADVSSNVRWSREVLSPDAAGWVASAVGHGLVVVLAGEEDAPTTAWVSSGSRVHASFARTLGVAPVIA